MFDVIGKRNWFFAFSLAITIPGLIFILLGPLTGGKEGLQFAIDFTGGTVWTIRFRDPDVGPDDIEAAMARQGLEAAVTQTGEGFMEIRTEEVGLLPPPPSPTPVITLPPASASASASAGASGSPSTSASPSAAASPSASASAGASPSAAPSGSPEPSPSPSPSPSATPSPTPSPSASASGSPAPSGSASPSPTPVAGNTTLPTSGRLGDIRRALEAEFGPIAEQRSLSTVGAVVSSDLITQALVLILVGSIGILLWITYRFRDLKFGATALVALLHDVVVVVGTFAVLGSLLRIEVDSLFVTAMLTVIGFSVHDTIVVFDRVRENKARHMGEPFARIVNHSILQTFGRSVTTSFTVVLTLLALLLFAGEAIGTFVLALLIGIISGTYSSIFNASPLLVVWQEWEDRSRARDNAARPSRRTAT